MADISAGITKLLAGAEEDRKEAKQWKGVVQQEFKDIGENMKKLEKATHEAVKGLEATVQKTVADMMRYQEESDKRMCHFEQELKNMAAQLEASNRSNSSQSSSAASASTRASSAPRSRGSGNFGQAAAKRGRSAEPTGRPSAHQELARRPNVLHLVRWPYKMAASDLQSQGKKVMQDIIPDQYKLQWKAKGQTQAVSLIFEVEGDADEVYNAVMGDDKKELMWTDSTDHKTYELFLKRDQSFEDKACGLALSKIWKAIVERTKDCVTLTAGQLVTDKPRRQLLLKNGFRLLSLFSISEPDERGHFKIVQNIEDTSRAPDWLTPEVIANVMLDVQTEMEI